MKKALNIFLIIVSIVVFASLIYIAIYRTELSKFMGTIGFILLGYISILLFIYGWLGLRKKD
jgi:hypothetical protein